MPLSSSLIASIVASIIETVVQSPQSEPVSVEQYQSHVLQRTLPPEARVGFMQEAPSGDGSIIIDGQRLALSPVARFRSRQNLIVMPMSVQPSNVVYVNDRYGLVYRVWMISEDEADSIKNN